MEAVVPAAAKRPFGAGSLMQVKDDRLGVVGRPFTAAPGAFRIGLRRFAMGTFPHIRQPTPQGYICLPMNDVG
jgi:hypothetical protein